MRNLLSAELYRFRRNPIGWILLVAAALTGVIYGVSAYDGTFDDMFVVPLFVLQAIFISLSIGKEYADGTIRNKIIAGKTKTVIFFSKLVMSMAVSVMMTVAFLIPCVSILSVNAFSHIPNQILLWVLVGFFLLNLVWAVIFTFVSTLISVKGVSGVVNLVLIIAVMFGAYQLESITSQPEFTVSETYSEVPMNAEEIEQAIRGTYPGSYSTSIDGNGAVTYSKFVITEKEQLPNPRYIKEPINSILRGVDVALPSGQINEYVYCLSVYAYGASATDADTLIETFPLYSLALMAGFTVIGLLIFRKKDLK
jgi:ABC-type transport system involved in multi-copper enzyme maturation permease subunit